METKSTCEKAKGIYLRNEKIKKQNCEKENAARIAAVIKYFTKIFPDIKYNKEKDNFELCGYIFNYVYEQPYNGPTYGFAIENNPDRINKLSLYSVEGRGWYIYNLEDLGRFLINQEQFRKDEKNRIEIKKFCDETFWSWSKFKKIFKN